jgi:hypothetical protein
LFIIEEGGKTIREADKTEKTEKRRKRGSDSLHYIHRVPDPQSTYRGREEIRGVHLPCQLERTPQLFSCRVKEGGRAHPILTILG